MKVNILMFAVAREILGKNNIEVELPDQATILQLKDALVKQFPDLGEVVNRSTFSVNQQYAHDSQELPDGAEIGMIPPVSGG